jgi:hypothetical protein
MVLLIQIKTVADAGISLLLIPVWPKFFFEVGYFLILCHRFEFRNAMGRGKTFDHQQLGRGTP